MLQTRFLMISLLYPSDLNTVNIRDPLRRSFAGGEASPLLLTKDTSKDGSGESISVINVGVRDRFPSGEKDRFIVAQAKARIVKALEGNAQKPVRLVY
jgi:hypothetical protein